MHQVSTKNTLMTKRLTLLCLLILSLGPMTIQAMEPTGPDAAGLDLRLLREDIPSLGTQPMSGSGMRPRDGFRSDLPYGAGYEARQGRGHGTTGSGFGSGSGKGSGMGQGGGRGAGGGRRR